MSEKFISRYWKDSVYSDGTVSYVNNQNPSIGETVKIRLRVLEGAPVDKIFLRYIADGSHEHVRMEPVKTIGGMVYYEAEIRMTQDRLRYQFYLISGDQLYCYTQAGLKEYLQSEAVSFCLISSYVQPEWVKHAVFYQIFPERFCDGDPSIDVKDGELVMDGYPSEQVRDWNQPPTHYEESHCMDFYGGDLEGIRKKIPYLKELGITALYLNPIFLAPTVHKYDCIDYEQVDPHFGGDEALAALAEDLHREGMRLILDISINHTGTGHRWFNRDGLYYDKSVGAYNNPDSPERAYYIFDEEGNYMGWRGVSSMPELNYRSEALRDKLYRAEDSVLKKWLKPPYSIDGWRFDVADVMAKYGPVQLSHEVWREIRRSIREVNPQAYILAEDWTDCSEYLQGEEWDSPMNYRICSRVWRQFIGSSDPALDVTGVLAGLRHRLTAENARIRITDFLSQIPFALQQNLFNLLDSHDVSRIYLHEEVDPEEYRGAVIAQFTMIGAPSVYYGDEAAIDGYVDSVEGCRFPMPWDSGFENGERYQLHRKLAHLRQEHSVFAEGSFQFLYAEGQILAFARQDEKECFLSVISSENEDRWIDLPIGILGVEADEEQKDRWIELPTGIPGVERNEEQTEDVLGRKFVCSFPEKGILRLKVQAHESYLLRVM